MSYTIPEQDFDGYHMPSVDFDYVAICHSNASGWIREGAFYFEPEHYDTYGLFNSSNVLIIASSYQGARVQGMIKSPDASGDMQTRWQEEYTLGYSYTHEGQTVWYNNYSGVRDGGMRSFQTPVSPANDSNPNLPRVAWLMVYGEYAGYRVTYDLTYCTGDEGNPEGISPSAAITNCTFIPDEGFFFYDKSVTIDGQYEGQPVQFVFDKTTGLLRIGPVSSDITIHVVATDDPYQQGGDTGGDDTQPEGGDGTFDDTSDDVNVPNPPTLSVVNTGMISMFSPSLAQVQALGQFMWSDAFDLDTFKKLFGDPMSAILGLSIVPVAPLIGTSVNVVLGNVSTSVSMPVITSQYVTKNLGAVTVEEYWGGYLDYSPYTQVEIYLPFVGMRPLSTDDVMGKTLSVNYTVDLLSGACIAFISVNGSVLYQFAGQCALSVPVTGNDWTNVLHSAISIAASIGTVVATGGLSAPASVALGATMAGNVMSAKTRVERSGSLSGSAGMMGVRKPYLIITRPRQALPSGLSSYEGYPALISRTLGSVSGFTTISSVHLDGLTCTEEEQAEIRRLLETGVIL